MYFLFCSYFNIPVLTIGFTKRTRKLLHLCLFFARTVKLNLIGSLAVVVMPTVFFLITLNYVSKYAWLFSPLLTARGFSNR